MSGLSLDNTTLTTSAVGPALVNSTIQNNIKPNLAVVAQDIVGAVLTRANVSEYALLTGNPLAGTIGAGAVALLLSARPDLVRNVEKTMRVIEQAAKPKPSGLCELAPRAPNFEFGHGVLNVGAAFDERTPISECLTIVEHGIGKA